MVLIEIRSSKKLEEKKQEQNDNKPKVYSENVLNELAKLIPEITFDEIMNSENYDQKTSDRYIFNFACSLGSLDNDEELNVAMKIVSILEMFGYEDNNWSVERIYQKYFGLYGEYEFNRFKEIIKKIIGVSNFSLIQRSYNGLSLSQFGSFVFDYYRKLKAELLVIQKNKELRDLYQFLMSFRSYLNYNGLNMDVNPIYMQARLLKKAIESIKEKGDSIYEDEQFGDKINAVHKLIDDLLDLQQTIMQDSIFNIQDHMKIISQLISSIGDIITLITRKTNLIFDGGLISSSFNPYPIIERYILENWEEIPWENLFLKSEENATPTQILLSFSDVIIEDSIRSYLLSKPLEEEISDLPDKPFHEIQEISKEEMKVRQEEYQRTKDEVLELISTQNFEFDYYVFRDMDISKFFKKMIGFYTLCFEGRVHSDDKITLINDIENQVKVFTGRPYILKKELD